MECRLSLTLVAMDPEFTDHAPSGTPQARTWKCRELGTPTNQGQKLRECDPGSAAPAAPAAVHFRLGGAAALISTQRDGVGHSQQGGQMVRLPVP